MSTNMLLLSSHKERRPAKRRSQRVVSMVGGLGIMAGPVQKLFELGWTKERILIFRPPPICHLLDCRALVNYHQPQDDLAFIHQC